MSRISQTLLSDTGDFWNAIGDPVKGAGWYSIAGGYHTVSINVVNLRGRVFIEGTLMINPSENDWFPISLNGTTPYIQYPIDPLNPTGLNNGDTSVLSFNFQGNFVLLRARLNRTYILPNPPPDPYNYGKVSNILLNL
ncbi:MAG: hypothetical protein NZZ41_02100 [Candidatus Dojkabacteria bacterium]|nr:hypothetical protein [Candidatus Dojkabacteria bacterium]